MTIKNKPKDDCGCGRPLKQNDPRVIKNNKLPKPKRKNQLK